MFCYMERKQTQIFPKQKTENDMVIKCDLFFLVSKHLFFFLEVDKYSNLSLGKVKPILRNNELAHRKLKAK